MNGLRQRLLVVANRLPVTFEADGGKYVLRPSSGGLVTALRPLLEKYPGAWIGWTGTDHEPRAAEALAQASADGSYSLVPVYLTAEEKANFYCGFSNEIVWPLFHDLQSRCNFDPAYWETYFEVNEKYADAILQVARRRDFIWVHDYHLMLVADCLRNRGARLQTAFFQHIPFPPPDIFEKLPWRREILTALLQFNVVGFQTQRDRRNFVACVRRFVRGASFRKVRENLLVETESRAALVGAFPIGIDFEEFAAAANTAEVVARAEELRRSLDGGQIVLGVDRLDYTKGIVERLLAFRRLLESHPALHRRITLVQVVVPSRTNIPKYRDLKLEIERLVSDINGRYGEPGWVPVHYVHRHLPRPELIAYYRAADIALITPLKDGMNLVAKEFCATRVDDDGVLILSEFAGAATQLKSGALLVNPYDMDGVAYALDRALRMEARERQTRMQRLRSLIRRHDVYRWCESFCQPTRSQAEPDDPADERFAPSAEPLSMMRAATV